MAGNYPETGTLISNANGSNRTSVSLSVHMLIKTGDGQVVGAVQSLNWTESGNITMVKEVGTDAIVDSCRTSAVNISGSCKRARMNRTRITEAFGREFLHVASQAYPFDIWVIDRQAKSQNDWITTVIKNVWIKSIATSISNDNWIMMDDMQWEAENIYSNRGASGLSGGLPAATGGDLGIKLSHIGLSDDTMGQYSAEQAADTGLNGRRGALDVPGLINAIVIN